MIDGGLVFGKYISNEIYFNKFLIIDCMGCFDSFRFLLFWLLFFEEEFLIFFDIEEWSKEF